MSSQILLNFAVPFTEISGIGDVDTSYLRRAAIVVKPKSGEVEAITEVVDKAELAALTDNKNGDAFFDGGLNKLYVIQTVAGDLSGVQAIIDANENSFFTLHISSDFADSDILAANIEFNGVISAEFSTRDDAKAFAEKHCAGVSTLETKGYGVCYALARLLSQQTFWGNQQYIDFSSSESIETISSIGLAESYFDDRLSFWIYDEDEGTRLGFFASGGEAITDKYISEELKLNMQSDAVNYIAINQPMNTLLMRVGLQNELQSVVDSYVDDDYLDPEETNEIVVSNSSEKYFVNGTLNIELAEPIWRMAITAVKG
ncbi:tail sheath protein [Vibrio phage 1.155.O._10N.222.55.B3]|nr:tail sheath protein [Vibrio phage 1.155.O._10N.222.55.B3]